MPIIALVALALAVAGCGGAGAVVSGDVATPAADASGSAALEDPITSTGPMGWDRGPFGLAGGTYELSWESDGGCSALYFGIVGADNDFTESPPTAGDVPISQMRAGSRTIMDVPPGTYYFNVSGIACKSYRATLAPRP